MKFIGFTIKGIEDIAKSELLKLLPTANIIRVESKAIVFEVDEFEFTDFRKLRTFDDIAIWVDEIPYDDSTNHTALANKIADLDFQSTRKYLQSSRDAKSSEFSLTVSLPGLENVSTNSFKEYLAKQLAGWMKWSYTEREHAQFDIRLFRGEDNILVGVRLYSETLHKRDYKQNFRRGSLRPTIAAALVLLATEGKTGELVDNFCGSGTILAEALVLGNSIHGGDIHKGSVHFTHQNLSNLDFEKVDEIKVQDAQKTDFKDDTFDFAVSNLPWGQQIEVDSARDVFTNALKEYKRILKSESKMVLLTKHPEIIYTIIEELFSKAKVESFTISLVGQQPTVIKIG